MIVENNINAGNFVVPVPAGLPIKVVYNTHGVLSSIVGMDSINIDKFEVDLSGIELSESIVAKLTDDCNIPKSICMRGGTTIIYGVVILDNYKSIRGNYPKSIWDFVLSNPFEVKSFLAYNMKSNVMQLSNLNAVRNWLSICKFSMLNLFLAPDMSNGLNLFNQYVSTAISSTGCTILMAYMVYDLVHQKLIDAELNQHEVSYVEEFMNDNGVFMCRLKLDSGKNIQLLMYTVKQFNMVKGSVICYNNLIDNITYVFPTKNVFSSNKYSNRRCPVCHSKVSMNQTVIRCIDDFCISRQYHSYVNMMNTLNSPYFGYDEYIKYAKKHKLTNIEQFISIDTNIQFNISLSTLLKAAIPVEAIRDRRILDLFISLCRNNWETIYYYLKNVNRVLVDFDFGEVDTREFIDVLRNSNYIDRIVTIHNMDNVVICESDKLYDADPILRGKVVFLTGRFSTINNSDMYAIISSYGAKIVDYISDDVDIVIIGDSNEDVDGVMVNSALDSNISVVTESEFLKHYKIDEDMKNNLLFNNNGGY